MLLCCVIYDSYKECYYVVREEQVKFDDDVAVFIILYRRRVGIIIMSVVTKK